MDCQTSDRATPKLKTSCLHFRVDRKDISFLRFILEAYDGLAVLTTEDPVQGLVRVITAPGCEGVIAGLIQQLATEGEIYLEAHEPPAANAAGRP